jgi:hypothetical protein
MGMPHIIGITLCKTLSSHVAMDYGSFPCGKKENKL